MRSRRTSLVAFILYAAILRMRKQSYMRPQGGSLVAFILYAAILRKQSSMQRMRTSLVVISLLLGNIAHAHIIPASYKMYDTFRNHKNKAEQPVAAENHSTVTCDVAVMWHFFACKAVRVLHFTFPTVTKDRIMLSENVLGHSRTLQTMLKIFSLARPLPTTAQSAALEAHAHPRQNCRYSLWRGRCCRCCSHRRSSLPASQSAGATIRPGSEPAQ